MILRIDNSLRGYLTPHKINFELEKYDNTISDSQFISNTVDFNSESYSILILNKAEYPLTGEFRFRSEESFDAISYFDHKSNNTSDVVAMINTLKELHLKPGVLAKEQIATLCKMGILLYEYKPKNIECASYDLTLESTFLKSGVSVENKESISINPFDFVIVGAKELANLPSNICSNYDLKVSMFCKGLILSNGPQIDPGYRGCLLALLFNTSSRIFSLEQHKGISFASMQFQTLSKPVSKRYSGKHLLKTSLTKYVNHYTKESMGDNVASMLEMTNKSKETESNVEENTQSIKKLEKEMAENTHNLGQLVTAGESRKHWNTLIVTGVIALMALFYTAINTYRDNSRIIDLSAEVAKISFQINSIEKTLNLLNQKQKEPRGLEAENQPQMFSNIKKTLEVLKHQVPVTKEQTESQKEFQNNNLSKNTQQHFSTPEPFR